MDGNPVNPPGSHAHPPIARGGREGAPPAHLRSPEPSTCDDAGAAAGVLSGSYEALAETIADESATLPMPADASTVEASATPARIEATGRTAAESALLRMLVARGMASPDEVGECLDLQSASADVDNTPPIGEFLIAHGSITRRQLERLTVEVEAQSATQQLPGFKVHRILGRGATGTVLKATQLSLDRPVAIKVLPRKLSADAPAVAALYAEGRAAAALNHPNIVQAFDVQQAGECHFFVMEYVEGKTVADAIRENGPFSEEASLDIIIPIADALAHAHERGLVHRDVKPRNIMLTNAGVPKLADLGLARAMDDMETVKAERGRALGTPLYISPEQIRGEDEIGPPADIYGLGATFYHMVTGKPPFQAADREQVFDMHLKTPPTPPVDHAHELSVGLSEVIEKMLAKDVKDRYQTCEQLLDELRAWKALCVLRKGERTGGARP